MIDVARLFLSLLQRLAGSPAAVLTRLADDADDVWEPFLLNDGLPLA